jgi:homoserine dehydrogenase
MKRIPFVLIGVGNVGRGLLDILIAKAERLRRQYGFELALVGCADSAGIALDPAGLDPAHILALKQASGSVADIPAVGQRGIAAVDLVHLANAELLVEASPVNLQHGQPGLGCIEAALVRGWHVVTANKAPLVLAYRRLTDLAQTRGGRLLFSATVGGGLPSVNLGRRDLAGATIEGIEACVNSTTTYILSRMAEGVAFDVAVREAQAAGIAEADPSLDVDGWDAGNKLVILANAVLGVPATLADVAVTGIRSVTPADLALAAATGETVRLVATAERLPLGRSQRDRAYELTVAPRRLPADHPLGRLNAWEMGIVYHTDIAGRQVAIIEERGPMATAQAVLRDIIDIFAVRRGDPSIVAPAGES